MRAPLVASASCRIRAHRYGSTPLHTSPPSFPTGGPYREALDLLCAELHSAALPLLIPTPNFSQTIALDRGKWTLNPAATGDKELRLFELFGAVRAAVASAP